MDADEYLKQLSRYIHLNPVRANLVEHPDEYKWSSYSTIKGKTKEPAWLESAWLLSQFATKRKQAITNYKKFVEEANTKDLKNPAKDLSGGFFLCLSSALIPQLRELKPRINIEKIVGAVGREFNCEIETILRKGRKRNVARDVAIYLARVLSGEKGKKIGEYFGNISGAAITRMYNCLLKQIENNKQFRNRIKKLKNKIINN